MLYDYYGFPDEAYQVVYPAPGDPALAQRVLQLLAAAGIPAAADAARGFDHGTFVPLLLTYPEAKIPVVQMSLVKGLDPRLHSAIGAALAPLRDEGVLIMGSGLSFHNMGALRRSLQGGGGAADSNPSVVSGLRLFDAWLGEAATQRRGAARNEALAAWAKAPGGRESHPREEHLLPLMVVAGAAREDAGATDFNDWLMGARVSGFVFGA
ncbi:hypothetical protein HYH03_011146 [Edaphochlamys debaryana]|uniref:Extradiol ring-cleavage dioxygenase class III enzyme subunit B domain-containing protein n=1 Tax=Edaphochlamys debaryana TaxID=47281 RepID=A0A836BVD5_9CHLO|nr:hypothetical protein HYH03_011146 [Edaphochlamys debaryana]|eukprot:KAG2490526.1 hypothetical protein HYH03_011146 [Edaphochlamys debaryana]